MSLPPIDESFRPLIGLPCWQVSWDCTVNLSLHFGQPSLSVREPRQRPDLHETVRVLFSYRHVTIRGEWHLWIEQAYWKVCLRDYEPVTSASSLRRITTALARLDGQQFQHISVNPSTGATRVTFDLGGELLIRRYERASERSLWSLYMPSGHVLSVNGTGAYSLVSGDAREEVWVPFR